MNKNLALAAGVFILISLAIGGIFIEPMMLYAAAYIALSSAIITLVRWQVRPRLDAEFAKWVDLFLLSGAISGFLAMMYFLPF